MALSPLAGKPAPKEKLIDLSELERAYYERRPDPGDADTFSHAGRSRDYLRAGRAFLDEGRGGHRLHHLRGGVRGMRRIVTLALLAMCGCHEPGQPAMRPLPVVLATNLTFLKFGSKSP